MLYPQRKGDQSWRLHIRLDTTGDKLCRRGKWSSRVDRELRHRQRCGESRIERCILVCAVSQSILKIVVHSESRANYGFRAERTPRHSDPRLRQEFRVIHSEQGIGDARLRRNHAIGERVVRGAAVRLIPASRKLSPESERHSKPRTDANGVLRI